MLNLQQKAHYALEEYRKGNAPPAIMRNPGDPHSPAEDDELTVLGGQTRYVTKAEPTSPSPRLLERSPVSQNPVVPLPLQNVESVDPNLVRYLQSFHPTGRRVSQSNPHNQSFSDMHAVERSQSQGYGDMDMATMSIYGMSTVGAGPSGGYQGDSGSTYGSQQQYPQQQHLHPSQPQHQSQHTQQPQNAAQQFLDIAGTNTFPQYFPVYDYSSSSMSTSGYGHSPLMDSAPVTSAMQGIQQQQPRRSSTAGGGGGSPMETANNMQSTWLDFVNTLTV